MLEILSILIIVLGSLNLIRLAIMMIGTDIHDVRLMRAPHRKRSYQPWISVIVPAYNEELGIVRCLDSLVSNDYSRFEVIVVNDGSSDKTASKIRAFQSKHKGFKLRLRNQKNAGKAAAINNGVKFARGSLIMVLDADSVLAPNAIAEVPKYFADSSTVLAAANVKVLDDGRLLSLVQRYEYLISYRSKKALNTYNMEYIIGGVGSTFRKRLFEKVGGYDVDTITEDIDFTLKVLRKGSKKQNLGYMSSVHAYTEGVMTVRDLVTQRYRWKYGRMQSFLKNKELFFNNSRRYDKRLTHYQLPYSLWAEVMFTLEPLLITYFIAVVVIYSDAITLLGAYAVTTILIAWNIIMDESETRASKKKLLPLAFMQYPLFFILSYVEYAALVKSITQLPKLKSSLQSDKGSWEHVARVGDQIKLPTAA